MHGFGRKGTARPFPTSMAGGGARVGGDDGYDTKSSERTEGKRRGAHVESAGVVTGLGEAARRAWGRRRSRRVEVEEGIDGVVLGLVRSSSLVEVTSARRRNRWTL